MNGALGVLRGYMWPEGGDPNSNDPAKWAPLCVFVEFDSVSLGTDESGRPRSFFPCDPPSDVPGSRRNWVPIFRQKVSSTVEDHLTRENFPLTLAWALTHWKAQGMTLERVRVHQPNSSPYNSSMGGRCWFGASGPKDGLLRWSDVAPPHVFPNTLFQVLLIPFIIARFSERWCGAPTQLMGT